MTRYSVQRRDQIFVKGYGFLSFAENMSKNIGKNIRKSLSDKYSFLIMPNNLLQMHLKLLQKDQFKKQQKQLVNLTGKKIADKIIKVSRALPQNSSGAVESET